MSSSDAATVADFRASLDQAFRSNTYERYRNRLSRAGLAGGGNQQEQMLAQLDNRSRQARHIERRLLFSLGDEAMIREEDEDNDDGDDDVVMRGRTRSSVNAVEMRRHYIQAKKRFKSIQQY